MGRKAWAANVKEIEATSKLIIHYQLCMQAASRRAGGREGEGAAWRAHEYSYEYEYAWLRGWSSGKG